MRYFQPALLLLSYLAFSATAAPLVSSDLRLRDLDNVNDEKRSVAVQARQLADGLLTGRTLPYVPPQPTVSLCLPGDTGCEQAEGSSLEALQKRNGKNKDDKGKKKSGSKKGESGEEEEKKSADYEALEKAAKKKGVKLEVGKSYLLTDIGPGLGPVRHHRLVVAKVERKENELTVEAFANQLVKDEGDSSACGSAFGGLCETDPMEYYSCARTETGGGKLKFSGEAALEFADPQHFHATSSALLERNTKYNVFFNNCQTFAKDLANVARQ